MTQIRQIYEYRMGRGAMRECAGGYVAKILGVFPLFAILFYSFCMLNTFSKQLPGVEGLQTFG